MIDRERRNLLADAIHQLLGGFLSTDEFDHWLYAHDFWVFQHPSDYQDAAIGPIVEHAWCLYSDCWDYRFVGRNRLDQQRRRQVMRWIMFLLTDLEYEWPVFRFINPMFLSLSDFLFSVVTLGIGPRIRSLRYFKEWSALGSVSVWPFMRQRDYEAERRKVCPFSGLASIGA